MDTDADRSSPASSPDGGDDIAARTRRVAAALTRTVEAVPDDAWDRPSPCAGWTARDVVDHLTSWMPAFFLDGWERPRPPIPSAQVDPVGAWHAVRDALQAALDDPAPDAPRPTPMGEITLAQAWATAGLPDVLVHTWDLARATGLDERLDPDEVAALAEGLDAMDPGTDAAMRGSGQFGPRVEVAAGADAQTRVLAFMGRTP